MLSAFDGHERGGYLGCTIDEGGVFFGDDEDERNRRSKTAHRAKIMADTTAEMKRAVARGASNVSDENVFTLKAIISQLNVTINTFLVRDDAGRGGAPSVHEGRG